MQKIKQFYIDSMNEFKKPKVLALCGMLAALAVVLSYVASIDIGQYVRIGFSSIPNRLVDALFGPVVGALFGGALDIIKFVVKPSGAYFFGFTFDAMLAGVIFGSIMYRRPLSLKRLLAADFLNKLIVNCFFNTLWLTILYGKAFSVLLPARLVKNLIMWPIDSIILFIVMKALFPVVRTLGYRIGDAVTGPAK